MRRLGLLSSRSVFGLAFASIAALSSGCLFYPFGSSEHDSSSNPSSQPPPSPKVQVTTSAPHEVFEMNASMSAQSDGQSIKVYAALLLGTDNFVVLDPGDYFTATIDGADPVVMVREANTDSKVHYVATFAAPKEATDVVVAFHRPNGRTGAPYSVVRVAPKFEITSAPPVRLRSGDVLDVTITPAPLVDDTMRIQFYGGCVPSGGPYPLLFDAGGKASFFVSQIAFVGTGCDVRVELRHETIGKVDSAFHRGVWGEIEDMPGLQERSISTALVR